jgi:2-polyprenyl-3-methyl-5-hydroxy-6-metoxy-1,4-benzoquinol methylase
MPGEGGPEAIPAVYERGAEGWDRRRSRALFERDWLERFAACLQEGAAVLDLGCGGGEPIARWLIERGFAVTGVDVAEPMLAICRRRWPGGEWLHGDMRALDLGRRFAGIVAWDSLFHLTAEDQQATFPLVARHLAPGGAFLFTSGPEAGEAVGAVEGLPVYHASLSPAGYAAALEAAGLVARAFRTEDPDCAGHSVWLARRR